MTGAMQAFIIWCIGACAFIGMGIYSFFSKKPRPMGFWANAEMFEVTDVKKYNAAMGKLFIAFGVGLMVLGLPLLDGQNSALIIFSILGVMAETIAAMVVYTTVIEKKYKVK